jgi:hypothetical protein
MGGVPRLRYQDKMNILTSEITFLVSISTFSKINIITQMIVWDLVIAFYRKLSYQN